MFGKPQHIEIPCYLPEELLDHERASGAQSDRQALLHREIQESDSRIEKMYAELQAQHSLTDSQSTRIKELERMIQV